MDDLDRRVLDEAHLQQPPFDLRAAEAADGLRRAHLDDDAGETLARLGERLEPRGVREAIAAAGDIEVTQSTHGLTF